MTKVYRRKIEPKEILSCFIPRLLVVFTWQLEILVTSLENNIPVPGFVPFFEQKLQGLFKDFQGHISHFSRTPFSAKKRFESMSFLVLPQHEQFYPEGLSY